MSADIPIRITYPDPFKPTGLQFTMPSAGKVTITLVDRHGRTISDIMRLEPLSAGPHMVEFPSHVTRMRGVYIEIIVAIGDEETRSVKAL